MMSFVLLLAVSLAALLGVETRRADTAETRLRARQNARLAVHVALGRLQSAAGPDRRTTARSDITDDGADAPGGGHWTGVWNTETGAFVAWLVSGGGTGGPSDEDITLAGRATVGADSARHAAAPAVPFASGSAPSRANRFAYWVADESLKASFGKEDRLARIQENPASAGLSALEAKRLAQISGGRPRIELIVDPLREEASEDRSRDPWTAPRYGGASIADLVARAAHRRGAAHVPALDAPTQGAPESELSGPPAPAAMYRQKHYHDLTRQSLGLLTNPRSGGLKIDLSDPAAADPAGPFPVDGRLRAFLGQRVDDRDRAGVHGAGLDPDAEDSGIPPGHPVDATPFVVTELALYLAVLRDGRYSEDLEVAVALRADIWNPYATDLAFTPEGVDDFTVSLRNLPPLRVDWETGRGSGESRSGAFTLELDSIAFAREDRPDESFTLRAVPYDMKNDLSVGEVRTVVERFQAPIEGIALEDEGHRSRSSDDFVALSAPSAEITVETRRMPAAPDGDGELVQRFASLAYDRLDTEAMAERNLVSRAAPSYSSDYQAVYHFKFEDEIGVGDLAQWTSSLDPRSPIMDLSTERVNDLVFVNADPAFAAFDRAKFLERPEFFFGGNGGFRRNYHRFFGYPATTPISVGLLQHAQFRGEPPFSVGNPWGGAKNAAFDRYFFSGSDPDANQTRLPNHHLQISGADATGGFPSAARYKVRGAFNLNATSVEAWTAQLAAVNLYDWKYRIFEDENDAEDDAYAYAPIARPHVQSGLFRFAHNADRTFSHPYTDALETYPEISQRTKEAWYKDKWDPPWAAAFTAGMRELRVGRAPGGIDDARSLAEAIVALLKERARPYPSLQALLTEPVDPADPGSAPLLQEAIDRTRINTVGSEPFHRASAANKFPRYAASFLTQADVIGALAPYAQVRGDTFTIRTCGIAANRHSAAGEARAYCEAVVQRTVRPAADEATAAEVREPSSPLGRRFERVQFRWLSENDI